MRTTTQIRSGFADENGIAVVAFPHEVDHESAAAVREELLVLLNRGAEGLVLDFSATEFCDSSGINAVLRAYQRAQALGASLRLVIPYASVVRRAFGLVGVDSLVPVFTSVEEARRDLLPRAGAGSR